MQLGESPSSLTTSPSPRLLRGSAVSAHAQIALGKHRDQNRTSKLPVWSAELDHEAMQYTGVSQSTEVLKTRAAPNDPGGGIRESPKSLI